MKLFSWMALHSDTALKEAAEAGMMAFINLIDFIELGVPNTDCFLWHRFLSERQILCSSIKVHGFKDSNFG